MPRPFGCFVLPQPDFSATSSTTPRMRPASYGSRFSAAVTMRGSPSSSSRNWTGSFPAACASSSMNDWTTNASALLPGARSGPVGTPHGITEQSSAKFGMKRAGNSFGDMPALLMKRSPSPNDTK